MNGLFSLSPFLFLVFIPALTMRLFADEFKQGTIEVLQTSPISNTKLVLSKYFSGLTLVCLAIIPTVVYYFSLSKLSETEGNIDTAGIIIHWTTTIIKCFCCYRSVCIFYYQKPNHIIHNSYFYQCILLFRLGFNS